MRPYSLHRRLFTVAICSILIACQPPPQTPEPAETHNAAPESKAASAGAIRDLTQDEAAGGHVLRKHVGRTDDELRERLRRERNISGASSYIDRPTAERAIGIAIAQNHDRIQRWLNRPGGHPNLTLDYDSDQPIGRTMNRGDSQSRPCSHALIVLKYAEPSYYILTSYPECR